jgi:hypothetical protein
MRGCRHGESLFHWGIACFIGVLLVSLGHCSKFVDSKGHLRRETDEFAKLASASAESLQRKNQTPVVVNNSG